MPCCRACLTSSVVMDGFPHVRSIPSRPRRSRCKERLTISQPLVRHLWLAIDRSPRRENAPANPRAPANRRRRLLSDPDHLRRDARQRCAWGWFAPLNCRSEQRAASTPDVPHFNDPEYYRRRVEESRVLAEQMRDETSKKTMLGIANDYEKLATRAAKLLHRQDEGELMLRQCRLLGQA